MQSILSVTVPFFALVLCGYWATRRGVLPEAAIPGLNAYVLFFALPCLLFKFGASMPFSELIDPTLVLIYVVCAMVMVFVTIAATLKSADDRYGIDLKNSAFGALVAAFPNTGFMGVPLLVALLGDAAAGPVISTVLIDLILTSTFCIALAQSQSQTQAQAQFAPSTSQPDTLRSAASRSLRGALANPLPWSIALGALVAATQLQLPGAVSQVIQMLADSASPVALFTIGAVLWRAGQLKGTKTPVAQFLPVALLKLFVHPLLVLSVGVIAKALGAPVPAFGLTVLVLAAALPSASNVSLLAERYGADNGRIARIIMASTVMAFVSFSLLAWALGAKPH
ncbi:MAG: AEC family transporter [Pseudorhodobacter sp.]|nr:AEC family transporter [Rhizobacter sp.]